MGHGFRPTWQAQGAQIGWVDGEDLYLDPASAYNAASGMLEPGMTFGVTEQRLRKLLREAGLLASTDDARGKITVRRVLQGSRRSVLHFKVNVLDGGIPPEAAHSAHSAPRPHSGGGNRGSWAGSAGRNWEFGAGSGPRKRPPQGRSRRQRAGWA